MSLSLSDLEAERLQLGIDVLLVHPAQLRVPPAPDAVGHGQLAPAGVGLAERVERARGPLVDRPLGVLTAGPAEQWVLGVPHGVADPARPERGAERPLVAH